MSRRLAGKKMTPGASTSVSPNVGRKKKNALPGAASPREMSITEIARLLYDMASGKSEAGASSSREMSITDPDDEEHMIAELLVDFASGNYEAGASSGIELEDRALAETVGRSSDVASGSGQSSRPKSNGKKPIWMKDYMGDAEEESE